MRKHLIIAICCMTLFSCKSKEEKFIQSEFDKVKGSWQIDGFGLGSISDSQKTIFSNSTILFSGCRYNAKDFKTGFSGCSGDIQVGSLFLGYSYNYDYEKKIFSSMRFGESQEYQTNNAKYGTNANTVMDVMSGDWDIIVNGDKMTARQVKNFKGLAVQVSFTATRKP